MGLHGCLTALKMLESRVKQQKKKSYSDTSTPRMCFVFKACFLSREKREAVKPVLNKDMEISSFSLLGDFV